MSKTATSSATTILTLPYSRKTCLVAPLTPDRHDNAFTLIVDAASRGDNVGVDEFPTIAFFKYYLEYCVGSWLFSEFLSTFNDEDNPAPEGNTIATGDRSKLVATIECLMFIMPSRFVRSKHKSVCQAFIVTSHEFSQRIVRRELTRIACEFALKSDAGFTACLLEVKHLQITFFAGYTAFSGASG